LGTGDFGHFGDLDGLCDLGSPDSLGDLDSPGDLGSPDSLGD
jgi:hypothetical protein